MSNSKVKIKILSCVFLILLIIGCKKKDVNEDKNIFVAQKINLGTISFNDTVSVEMKIKNPYKHDLLIKNSASSCGCTQLVIKETVLKPNQYTIGLVKFIPSINGLRGNVEKAVVLETNSPKRFHEIIIKADVK